MKQKMEKILRELVADYESTRAAVASIPVEEMDAATHETGLNALANTLVLMQTQLHNLKIWQEYLNLQEEHKSLKLRRESIISVREKEEIDEN